jgi:hypothetical protein
MIWELVIWGTDLAGILTFDDAFSGTAEEAKARDVDDADSKLKAQRCPSKILLALRMRAISAARLRLGNSTRRVALNYTKLQKNTLE